MVQVLDLWSAPFCSKGQAASCYVAQLESAIHGALLLLIAAGATVRAIFHKCCRAFGPDLVRCALLGQAIGTDASGSVQYQYP